MIKQRLAALRNLFKQNDINGYVVPSNDEYMSEYTPEYANRLKFITGFTGSNGIAVICETCAFFFTDGRYLEQSEYELEQELFKIFDLKSLPKFPWSDYTEQNSVLGYDPKLFTKRKLEAWFPLSLQPDCHPERQQQRISLNISNLKGDSSLSLRMTDNNLIDQIWLDRPPKPYSKVYIHPTEFAGEAYTDKVAKCRSTLAKYSADTMVISNPDSICWLLNLRSSDIPHSPLMLCKLLITMDKLYLFIDSNKIHEEIIAARPIVTILPEEKFKEVLLTSSQKVLIDENASVFIVELLTNKIVERITDPCQLPKACKNDIEIKHATAFHVKDAVALCEFFAYLASFKDLAGFTEYDLGELLTGFRSKQSGYVMDSFHTICGFQENSSIIHYRAKKDTAKKIVGNGILLIDSGGQYLGSTTDVTRTITIGIPTSEQKTRYTQVLKGHIALSSIKFPVGVINGAHLDILARQFLWRSHQDYPHGTGHGVGSFLSVHEGPQNISINSNVCLRPGMIVSNEPGFYKAKEFGIRIENLMYVRSSDSNWLEFETLTLLPYAKELIDFTMLNSDETYFISKYYQKIKEQVYPLLSATAQKWLINCIESECLIPITSNDCTNAI